MSSRRCALLLMLILGACGGDSPPRNLDNACSIVDQRPNYLRAMKKTEKRWGAPVPVQMAIIHQESKFDSDARTPHQYALGIIPMGRQSSAYGYAQALDGTWDEYKRTAGRRSAKRTNINDATDFIGWYMDRSQTLNGISKYDARNQYLAYHEGNTGFARGSYRGKSWLVSVSNRVSSRAALYQAQLKACKKI
ncbi:transglycosylase SLT domain-containing protein [Pseudoruegeria sp. SK021]|uniref:transglycosylase SLT domain-containing protein n=1 Tax=Pseudoruegeria sp. SK021 TaxID=1933035 RepID=UPI000A257F5D|nr:transglycosylase SLT domain-containing protein [Pseudoruegeria sp. SK021]OSP55050.1 lytic transglycosylase [Pseudoruegeria sp. SK021]